MNYLIDLKKNNTTISGDIKNMKKEMEKNVSLSDNIKINYKYKTKQNEVL